MSKVSIITPTKASAPEDVGWLQESIESVLEQTEPDWEMIVINDHSTESWRALQPFFKNPRIRGARADDVGVSHARNQAAKMARSELLLPLDADDKLTKNAIGEYLRIWGQEGHKHGLVYSNTVFLTEDGQRHYQSPEYDFDKLLNQLLMPVGCLHRKSDWERSGGWKPEMEYGLEDWEYWITLGELGVCGYHLNMALYLYRRHARGRLAYLREHEDAYMIAYQQMRGLHLETYSGRRPVGCCGAPIGRAMPPQHRPGSAQTAQGLRDTLAGIPTGGLAQIRYAGAMQAFYVAGRATGLRYHIEGPGKLLIMPDGRVGVDPRDVGFITKLERGKVFLLA